jgi:predicted peroxiredoxin
MAAYTFISSRDPVDGDRAVHDVARELAGAGNDVTLFLVENGAFLARKSICADLRKELKDAGVEILADDFALAERGILADAVAAEVSSSKLDVVVDHLAAGRKVSWH